MNSLIEYAGRDCNRINNGKCMTLHCLKRGGYSGRGPIGEIEATCEEFEIVTALIKLQKLEETQNKP